MSAQTHPVPLPAVQPLPSGLFTLEDHEALAHQQLDANAWAYFSGGAADELTLRANLTAWRTLNLLPRALQPLAAGHTRIELLGRTLAHPILLAPVAFQQLAHQDGEIATAHAAASQGAGLVLSTQSSTSLESVASAYLSHEDAGPLWFQLYFQPDRGFTRELVKRAEAAGYEALVLTVDAPTHGARDRERRAGFKLPPGISAVNLAHMPAPAAQRKSHSDTLFNTLLTHSPTWDDVAWLQSITRLPVILKGIVNPLDASQAAQLQVAAIVVSNHGGRTLDTLPSTASVLPLIADATAGRLALLVDGGIRRGTDVLKALALGATAVLVGRPYVYGLANAGAMGVAHVIRLLRDELEIAMALTGCACLERVPKALIFRIQAM